MREARGAVGWSGLSRWRRSACAVLLALPVVAMLVVPLYARPSPELAGVPFFYWYQFAGVPLSMAAMALTLRLLRPSGGAAAAGGVSQARR